MPGPLFMPSSLGRYLMRSDFPKSYPLVGVTNVMGILSRCKVFLKIVRLGHAPASQLPALFALLINTAGL